MKCASKSNEITQSSKADLVSILSRPDLLAGAEYRPPLECLKISQFYNLGTLNCGVHFRKHNIMRDKTGVNIMMADSLTLQLTQCNARWYNS